MEEHKADRIFLRRYPALALLIFACGGIVFFSLLTVAPVYLLLLTALSACAALVLALSFSSTKKAGPHIPASAALMLAVFFLFGYLAAKTPQTPVLNDENFYEVRATIRDISEVRDILLVSLCDVTAGEVSIGDASTSVPLRCVPCSNRLRASASSQVLLPFTPTILTSRFCLMQLSSLLKAPSPICSRPRTALTCGHGPPLLSWQPEPTCPLPPSETG
ncbi:MAG: hypothetical protein U5N86_03585 [Planctomycetota bacterium]|nr:hypothetical protein [Planctomycetota bacterium]